ncbi:MAG: hypothetical protein KJ879_00690 [Nanoarchaeota archaeon]|nr:hypothetical protein [Nanoarchaeota archaeon]
MTIYLAYQFGPEQLTEGRFIRIVDDYFELVPKELEGVVIGPATGKGFLEYIKSHADESRDLAGKSLLEKAAYFTFISSWIKRHPLLEISFCDKGRKGSTIPDTKFTGLNIHAHHSGSEGVVDLVEFKPEIGAYLSSIGIDYKDRSKLSLD